MNLTVFVRVVVAALILSPVCHAEDAGWTRLFNGRDLTGWVPVNVAPNTFTVRDGMIVSTGVPTGVMRSERQYENFIVELEWRHMKAGGNAGFFVYADPLTSRGVPFVRAIEVQVLDGDSPEGIWTGHGDLFSIHGARMKPDRPHPRGWERCLPSERRAKPAGEWNHYRVESRDGRLTLAVNGKVVSGASQCRPRRGYLCLESEGSECHFRNLRIQEFPPSKLPDADVAPLAEAYASLYTGVDLAGWKMDDAHRGHWRATDWILDYDGKCESPDPHLWTTKEYRNFVLICDWRLPMKPRPKKFDVILPNGDEVRNDDGSIKQVELDDAGDSGIYLRGSEKAQVNITCKPIGSGEISGYRRDTTLPRNVRAACVPKRKVDAKFGEWNRFEITVRGERVTVVLNGETVIENALLPGLPASGPIALQSHGDPIQFASLFVRELP
jgi:hypothetical protein